MESIQQQMQNFLKPTTYSNLQLDTSNVNFVQDISVALDNVSSSAVPITPPTMNENQPLQAVYPNPIQAVTSTNILQPMQNYRFSHLNPQEATVMNVCSFFYAPCNDFQIYHINCKEIPLSFEGVSQLMNHIDSSSLNQSNNIYTFYHEQPEIKKIYQVTCEMVSHTSIFRVLNKIIYGIQSTQNEYQWQEFSEKHQENLKFHLKKDLIYYLAPNLACEQNYSPFKSFTQDYCNENTMNTNTDTFNNFQQYNYSNILPFDQSYTFQDNIYQLVGSQDNRDDYNQGYNPFQF